MQKIFQEYGGVIATAMAIVALIGLIGMLFTPGGTGWMDNAFHDMVDGFINKVEDAVSGENNTGELVGYSYNGTVLPEIPEWDKETYPYAYLVSSPGWAETQPYTVWFSSVPAVYDGESWDIPVPCASVTYITSFGQAKWGTVSEITSGYSFVVCEENPNLTNPNLATRQLVWCSVDVTYPDSTIFMPASEPAPVYD